MRDEKGRFIKGHSFTPQMLQKMQGTRPSLKGNTNGFKKGENVGKNNHEWKGDKASYRVLHKWVEQYLGKAYYCSFNKNHLSTRYHWANISGLYLRDLTDWMQLCPSCHKKYDKNNSNKTENIFIKGKNGYLGRRN